MSRRRRRRRRSTPTPARIWRILNAIARERRIADRREAAHAARFRKEMQARRRREAARAARFRKERQEWKRREAALAERFRTAEEKRRKAEEKRRKEQAERDRKLDQRLNRIAGDGDNRWGRLMEALVEGDLLRLLQDAGVPVSNQAARVRSNRGGKWREYDLVALGESDAVVVEVKTTLRRDDIPRFGERLRDFRDWRRDYARPRVWGGLAYLTVQGEAARLAEAAGFYLIRAVGSSAKLVNSKGFEPRPF